MQQRRFFMKNFFVIFIILISTILYTMLLAVGEWHPELDHWPRTVLETESLELVRSRIAYEPYSTFYSRIITKSGTDYEAYPDQIDKAEICRSAAFRFLIESDSLYAQKALDYLLIAQREPADSYLETYDNIIWDSETLTSVCSAYDFLKGNNFQFAEDETTVRSNISTIASGLYDDITNHFLISIIWNAGGKKTNFGVKLASALGLAAIVLNNEGSDDEVEQPQTWINYAMELLDSAYHSFLVDSNGGWAEGQHYQKFVTFNLIPFIFAHTNFIDGATETYGSLTLPPLLDDEQFRKNQEIGIALRMPDGTRPNFDDSFNNPHYISGIFSQYYNNDIFAWDFINAPQPYNSYTSSGYLDIEMICLFDDSFSGTTTPEYLTRFLPEAGQVIFRNSWDNAAVYMCLLGENSIARTGGRGHEHPDNGSYIIQAYGELLAMDSGYLSYDMHDSVRFANNHSLILVDGEGPPASNIAAAGGTDAYIEDYFELSNFAYAEVNTTYQAVDFSRNVTYLYDKYFVITDLLYAQDEHTYQWLLHGNGGGDTGNEFVLLETGGRYSVNDIDLTISLTASEESNIYDYDDYHEAGYNSLGTHTVLSADIFGDNVSTIAFLIPTMGFVEQAFTPLSLPNSSGAVWEMPDCTLLVLAKTGNEAASTDFLEVPFSTDAKMTLLSSTGDELPAIIHLKECSIFTYDNVDMIQSNLPLNVALNIFNNHAEGFISRGGQLDLFCGNQPSSVTGADSYSYDSGLLSLSFSDSSYFDIEVEWSLVNTQVADDAPENGFKLLQNVPNPFNSNMNSRNSGTMISFTLPQESKVILAIYNLKGQKINTLLEGEELQIGQHDLNWDGRDDNGQKVGSGVYFYQIKTAEDIQTKKMLLIK